MSSSKTLPEFQVCLNEEGGMEVQECDDVEELREAIRSHRYCAPEDITTIEAWLSTEPKPGDWCEYFKGMVVRTRSERDAREEDSLHRDALQWRRHIGRGYDLLPRDLEDRD